ncbi:MAG: putative membrane protein/Uncharacterized membrane protein [Chloroflexi bacterium]|jgi:uncharacterized membrane protein|nr:MAG: putative membrane protein/Uncharacterized membrane protein [Chloroflexota bacterium]
MLRRFSPRLAVLTVLSLFVMALTSTAVVAQDAFTFTAASTEVTHTAGQTLRIDLSIANHTDGPLDILLDIPVSPGAPWYPEIRGRIGTFEVARVTIQPDPTETERTLTTFRFLNDIPEDAAPGEYNFSVRARTADGRFSQTIPFVITIKGSDEEAVEDLEVETRFPLLRGPADASFEFAVTLRNRSSEELILDLAGLVPEGWDLAFKPSFEEKFFTSISVSGAGSQSLDVIVTPSRTAAPGQYPVQFTAGVGERTVSADFGVILTGNSEVRLGTSDGRLNAEASAGNAGTVPVVVFNTGTIPLAQVDLIGQGPSGWDISFDQASAIDIQPGLFQEVRAHITPTDQALPGDYSVTIFANSPDTSDTMELRITVTKSSVWGWVGLAIVAVVALGLVGLFVRLGRR